LATCAVGALGAVSTSCGDRAQVYVHLERTPVESSARGSIQLKMNETRSVLRLRVHNLLPESEYLLLADGLEQARFTTNPGGHAKLQLLHPPLPGYETLGFDPRGKRIAVSDGNEDRLSAVVDGPGEPPWSHVLEDAGIPASDPAEPGQVRGVYRTTPFGCRIFNLSLRGVAPGTYQVRVDGVLAGEIETDAGRQATLRLQSPAFPGGLCLDLPGWGAGGRSKSGASAPLDLEPRGARVEVVRDGEVLFAGPMRARVAVPEETEVCSAVDIEVDLNPTHWFGAGDASMKSKDEACDHEFRVTARHLPVANYELWVAGSMVGTVPVRNWPGESRGEGHFDSVPDEPGELLLDFDPRGQPLEVRRPMTPPPAVYLEALFPTE
jgi:hypothetical protein